VKALIVGAAGQLGRALAAAAPPHATLAALDRGALDITDAAAVDAALRAHRPDLVINAAAYTAVDRAESDSERAFAINATAATRLAAVATAQGARLVHVSTDFVFDGTASSPYPPDAPTAPLGVYGASKLAGERGVQLTAPDALILRTAWVYAAEGANFLRTMLRLMDERDEVRVVCDQVGTPTHAASLARAIWRLTEAGAAGIHHWTDAGVASWYDFAVAIAEEAQSAGLLRRAIPIVPIPTSAYPTPARRPAYSVLDKQQTWALAGIASHWRCELRAALDQMKEVRR
jgi:dTDP-4-dehydrorhamnose reductase